MSSTRLSGGSQQFMHARNICALPCQGMRAITLKLVQELPLRSVCSPRCTPLGFPAFKRHNPAKSIGPQPVDLLPPLCPSGALCWPLGHNVRLCHGSFDPERAKSMIFLGEESWGGGIFFFFWGLSGWTIDINWGKWIEKTTLCEWSRDGEKVASFCALALEGKKF